MDRNLLKRYFEKQCSATEAKAVEEWLLDSNNQTDFEKFLETQWDVHVDQHLQTERIKGRPYKSIWWKAAAAAVVLCIGAYYYGMRSEVVNSRKLVNVSSPQADLADQTVPSLTDTFQSSSNPKITMHYERKPDKNKFTPAVASADTANQEHRPKTVKPAKLGNIMVNEVLLSKLRDQIDSNTLVLNIDVHEVSFQRFSAMLRHQYGIILEPCDDSGMNKTYTARFEKISFSDLLSDMSEKMLFTYSFQDSIVKICFN
ncbi:hypothetical protein FAZ15_01730 [Sphingobacterium olei]|uniref:DUF4974 domain-containing protein n=1 Tax=Sphingobacterium olei TaxID=2571155 RepID=A0A4U0P8C4_9SPHI|nr:hypothetical protein [Sphingobacterium olei]TJZ63042.1 hypothetical protein FAZ15_01730 [Sphingobacterium olei]